MLLTFLKVIVPIVILVCVVLAVLYFKQEIWMFHPQLTAPDYKYSTSLPSREITFDAAGLRIHALLVEATQPQGNILYLHGNAGNLETWSHVAEQLATKLSWNVWVLDYPGFGKSSGRIESERQLIEISEAFRKVSWEQDTTDTKKWVIFGRSLGSGMATWLASKNEVSALILETPYTRFSDVVKRVAPWAPHFILRYRLPTIEWFPEVRAPIIILHGTADGLVPHEMAENLSKLNPRSQLVSIPRGEHSNLSQFPEYWRALQKFFDTL
ncbi:MAG: alpha/beta fold hydrolase [Proteobacteria bacterium]|nr:MAG: alpha/beta fold hydrolase [Pseudomonadota bacterium]